MIMDCSALDAISKINRIKTITGDIHCRLKRQYGRVLLVGAGPNDPELLTVKAYKAIEQADVVVFDRLVGQDILNLIPDDCQQIYVGKRCGQPSLKQDQINQILIEQAKQGKQVVRLKGGDPFIFGRGGEEALALVAENIEYDVIPGITAAIGCAATAKIPLTHRNISRSVTLVTGHVTSGAFSSWAGLVSSGQTLVFYMGLEQALNIQQGLMSEGLNADFPLAIIGNGCSENQQVHVSQISDLVRLANDLKGLSPALIIIGEVVTLRKQLLQPAYKNEELSMEAVMGELMEA
ncbi:uroporphyrinogen-III C-methyltransferase [Vibrio sp. S17_S38]|uniref:uroporphyrinogen-III C-methyltransferase n=1 Tax=Vibrio sp. S17_S38 TaxID=2720229 RepID=UPI00168113F4|nr:uroporphyrinogen-III C-methyltransferase [Vibrio sp. S17_S38]MBD1574128.1 uroporphyrinogen-III C-methyltransferase [Vibrio sp. S17_S38]